MTCYAEVGWMTSSRLDRPPAAGVCRGVVATVTGPVLCSTPFKRGDTRRYEYASPDFRPSKYSQMPFLSVVWTMQLNLHSGMTWWRRTFRRTGRRLVRLALSAEPTKRKKKKRTRTCMPMVGFATLLGGRPGGIFLPLRRHLRRRRRRATSDAKRDGPFADHQASRGTFAGAARR